MLARTQRNRAQRVDLIGLAVADKRPYLAVSLFDQPAVLQVPHKPRLVDSVERSNAHRHGRELPEVLHQPGVRIARQPRLPAQLVAEVLQPRIIEAALKICARIHARRSVSLEVNKVARLVALRARILGVEKVIEPNLKQRRQRRVRRNVSADAGILLILPMHHRHRIPADQRLHAPLQLAVARIGNFVELRNRVAERRRDRARRRHARLARTCPQRRQHRRALFPVMRNDVVKRLNPLGHLGRQIVLGRFIHLSCHRYSPLDPYALGVRRKASTSTIICRTLLCPASRLSNLRPFTSNNPH